MALYLGKGKNLRRVERSSDRYIRERREAYDRERQAQSSPPEGYEPVASSVYGEETPVLREKSTGRIYEPVASSAQGGVTYASRSTVYLKDPSTVSSSVPEYVSSTETPEALKAAEKRQKYYETYKGFIELGGKISKLGYAIEKKGDSLQNEGYIGAGPSQAKIWAATRAAAAKKGYSPAPPRNSLQWTGKAVRSVGAQLQERPRGFVLETAGYSALGYGLGRLTGTGIKLIAAKKGLKAGVRASQVIKVGGATLGVAGTVGLIRNPEAVGPSIPIVAGFGGYFKGLSSTPNIGVRYTGIRTTRRDPFTLSYSKGGRSLSFSSLEQGNVYYNAFGKSVKVPYSIGTQGIGVPRGGGSGVRFYTEGITSNPVTGKNVFFGEQGSGVISLQKGVSLFKTSTGRGIIGLASKPETLAQFIPSERLTGYRSQQIFFNPRSGEVIKGYRGVIVAEQGVSTRFKVIGGEAFRVGDYGDISAMSVNRVTQRNILGLGRAPTIPRAFKTTIPRSQVKPGTFAHARLLAGRRGSLQLSRLEPQEQLFKPSEAFKGLKDFQASGIRTSISEGLRISGKLEMPRFNNKLSVPLLTSVFGASSATASAAYLRERSSSLLGGQSVITVERTTNIPLERATRSLRTSQDMRTSQFTGTRTSQIITGGVLTVPPSIITVPPPPPPPRLPPGMFSIPPLFGMSGGRPQKRGGGRQYQYIPSLVSREAGLTATKAPKTLTGIEIRPIINSRRRKQ